MELSVIVPTYNASDSISVFVQNLMNQTHENFEVIFINDGSTDNTLEILIELADEFDNIIVLNQENKGPGEARNLGIKHAVGKYIMFVDCDDVIKLNMFSEMCSYIKEYDADIVQCNYEILNVDGEIKNIESSKEVIFVDDQSEMQKLLTVEDIISPYVVTKIFKSKIIKGIEFPSYYYAEDQVFMVKVLLEATQVVIVPEVYYTYVTNNDSITKSGFSLTKLDSLKSMKSIIEIYDNNYPELSPYIHWQFCKFCLRFGSQLNKKNDTENEKLIKIRNDYKLSFAEVKKCKKLWCEIPMTYKVKYYMYRYNPNLYSSLRQFSGVND